LQLVGDLLKDLRLLLRQEVALARAEVREELGRVISAAALAAIAVGTLSIAGLWLLIAVTRGIATVFNWPVAAVYAGVGAVIGIIGVVLAAVAWRQVRTLRVLPKTRETLRENTPWVARRVNEAG
jgi:hypothetical protein